MLEKQKCVVCGEYIVESITGIPQCIHCGGYFHNECWFAKNGEDCDEFEDFCSQKCYEEWKRKKGSSDFYW